jgi:hypothetical protein
MNDLKDYKRDGDVAYGHTSVGVFTFNIGATDTTSTTKLSGVDLEKEPLQVQQYRIIPFGDNNDLPVELAKLLSDNNLTPGILNKKANLLWGQGPAIYEERYENGKRVKYYDVDTQIENWLDDWDYLTYLQKAVVEFRHINGHFTKYFQNQGPKIGRKAFIAELVHVSSLRSRLEWPDYNGNIRRIITGDFHLASITNLKAYPVFDLRDPFKNPLAMNYSNMYSFAMENDYSMPDFWGTRSWIQLSSSLASLLMSFNSNSAAIKYHITSPAIYWEQKREALQEDCIRRGITYKESMLDAIKDETFKTFTAALSNVKNVGKFITTEEIFDDQSNTYVGWKIEVLDQKVKDYIDAQINIAKRAALETTTGLGLHPALSNISTDGNLPSGSEQLYAFKLYLQTDTDIPESIVCRDINNAIKANFPKSKKKIGFYHDVVITEESTSSKDRIKNN